MAGGYLLSSFLSLRSIPSLQLYTCNSSLGVLVNGLAGLTAVQRAKKPYCFILPLNNGLSFPSNLNDCKTTIKLSDTVSTIQQISIRKTNYPIH